jgi:sterol desaturase/sphingolipid hydroxylase (fatty acid hydroxylase superfamily)
MRRARRPASDGAKAAGTRDKVTMLDAVLVKSSYSIPMMTVILVVVLLVWAVGVLTAYTLGGLIHLLLLLALIILLIDILDRRKVL